MTDKAVVEGLEVAFAVKHSLWRVKEAVPQSKNFAELGLDPLDTGFPFYESVFLRPKMYTMSGGLEECISFLQGYYSGLATFQPLAPSVVEWGHFHDWLADQMGVGPSDAFRAFRERYGSGDDAVQRLLAMAGRFRAIK